MNRKMILLVEDNQDDEELAVLAFSRSRLANQLIVVRDGQEALDYLCPDGASQPDSTPVLPELVLLDLKLPKVDGLEVLRRIRADPRTRTLPVVILTSSQEQDDLVKSYHLGANSYVRKPVDFNLFCDAMSQIESYWLVLNTAIVTL